MPLDTQPLSRTRRAFLLVTLIALFAASLGFAQFLVQRHPAPAKPTANVTINWNLPKELLPLPQAEDQSEDIAIRALGTIAGKPREFAGFLFDMTEESPAAQAQNLFHEYFDFPPAYQRTALIANIKGVEVEGAGEDARFAILRLVTVQGKAVAICYSGAGPITDGDKLFLNQLAKRVEVHAESPTTRK